MTYPAIYEMDFDRPCQDNTTIMLFDIESYYNNNSIKKNSDIINNILFPNIRFGYHVDSAKYKEMNCYEIFKEKIRKNLVLMFTKSKKSCKIGEFIQGSVITITLGNEHKKKIISQLKFDNINENIYCILIYKLNEWELYELMRRLQFIKDVTYNQENKENLFKMFILKYNDIIINIKEDIMFNTTRRKYLNNVQNELVQPVINDNSESNDIINTSLQLTNTLSYITLFELPDCIESNISSEIIIDLNNENINNNNNDILVLSIVPSREINQQLLSLVEQKNNKLGYCTSNVNSCLLCDYPLSFVYGKQLSNNKAIYYKTNSFSGEIIFNIQTQTPIGISNIILSSKTETSKQFKTQTFFTNNSSLHSNAFTFLNFNNPGFLSLMKEYFHISPQPL